LADGQRNWLIMVLKNSLMFTGIIETLGLVKAIEKEGSNQHFCVESTIGQELKVDQSVSHNGVCLTVTKVEGECHWVTAIDETLQKSTLGKLKAGDRVNLERCMVANGRFDGHIVQGHVDQVGICKKIKDENGSWLFDFQYDDSQGNVTVEKGSICINGVSLTCFNSTTNGFTVAIIPYTYKHTTFGRLNEGDIVNFEFDIVGKYVKKLMGIR
jgi:riboflavin synthase